MEYTLISSDLSSSLKSKNFHSKNSKTAYFMESNGLFLSRRNLKFMKCACLMQANDQGLEANDLHCKTESVILPVNRDVCIWPRAPRSIRMATNMFSSIIMPSPMHLLHNSDPLKSGSPIKLERYSAQLAHMVKPILLSGISQTTRRLQTTNFVANYGISTVLDDLMPELQSYMSSIDLEANKSDAMLGHRFGHRIPYKVPNLKPELLKPPIVGGRIGSKNQNFKEEYNFGILESLCQTGSIILEMLMNKKEKIINKDLHNRSNSETLFKMDETNIPDSISKKTPEGSYDSQKFKSCDSNFIIVEKESKQQTISASSTADYQDLNSMKTAKIFPKTIENHENSCSTVIRMPSNVLNSPSRKKKKSRKKIKKSEARNTLSQPKDKLDSFTEQFETLKVGGARRVTNRKRHKRKQALGYSSNLPRPSSSGCQKVYQMDYTTNHLNDSLLFNSCDDVEFLINVPFNSFTATIPDANCSSQKEAIECQNSAISFILNGNDDIYESDSEYSLSDDSLDQDDWQMFKEDFEHFQDCLLMDGNFDLSKTTELELEVSDDEFHIIITSENIDDQGYENSSASHLLAINQKWNEDMKDNTIGLKVSKVHFAPDDSLCQVKEFEKSNEEDCESDWFLYKLMRCRFKRRVCEMEPILSPYLKKNHRDKIFQKMILNC